MSGDSGIRVTRKRGYTIVFNDLLPTGGTLSARAWGLYVYLIGRPDGWETRVSHLQSCFREGRDAIYKALGELVEHGLMEREEYTENGSGLRRIRYAICDDPVAHLSRSAPDTDSQDPGTQEPGKPDPDSQEPEKPGEVTTEPTTPEVASTEGATSDSLRSSSQATAEPRAPKRGTRLPADWEVPEALKDWFRAQPFATRVNPVMETEKFKNYWAATSGQRGVKLDWEATWRNWMITAAERVATAGGRAPQHPEVDPKHRQSRANLF